MVHGGRRFPGYPFSLSELIRQDNKIVDKQPQQCYIPSGNRLRKRFSDGNCPIYSFNTEIYTGLHIIHRPKP
jgi:hypothetical protein